MSYCTMQQARDFVRAGSGKCDTAELTALVNQIRRHFYNFYNEIGLFADVVESYRVERFYPDASNHGECFDGITLGRDVAAIESMWWNQWPVTLRSSWREWNTGVSPYRDCGLEKFDLPGLFSTVADLVPNHPRKLRFQCYSPADAGKTITITGTGAGWQPLRVTVELATDPRETLEHFTSIEHQGGVVKDVTTGRVALAESTGRLLGLYEPDETVPSYRRVRLTGMCAGCSVVNIRAARTYYPLTADTDVVETDNEPAWDAMARYLDRYQKPGATQEDMKIAAVHLSTAKQHILGEKSRQQGKGTRGEVRVAQAGVMPMRARLNSATPGRFGW